MYIDSLTPIENEMESSANFNNDAVAGRVLSKVDTYLGVELSVEYATHLSRDSRHPQNFTVMSQTLQQS